MFKSFLKPVLTATTLVLLAGQGAIAAPDANHPQGSFRTVVNMGFRVVATEAIPAEVAQSVGMTNATAITIVTLQNGPAVAVCTFSTKSWIFMSDSDLESASACDYRDYASATQPAPLPAPAAPAATDTTTPAATAPATTDTTAPAPAAPSATPAPAAQNSGHAG